MRENRKAAAWLELKDLEKDYFHELQFVCWRVQQIRRLEAECRILLLMMVVAVLLPTLLLAVVDLMR